MNRWEHGKQEEKRKRAGVGQKVQGNRGGVGAGRRAGGGVSKLMAGEGLCESKA